MPVLIITEPPIESAWHSSTKSEYKTPCSYYKIACEEAAEVSRTEEPPSTRSDPRWHPTTPLSSGVKQFRARSFDATIYSGKLKSEGLDPLFNWTAGDLSGLPAGCPALRSRSQAIAAAAGHDRAAGFFSSRSRQAQCKGRQRQAFDLNCPNLASLRRVSGGQSSRADNFSCA